MLPWIVRERQIKIDLSFRTRSSKNNALPFLKFKCVFTSRIFSTVDDCLPHWSSASGESHYVTREEEKKNKLTGITGRSSRKCSEIFLFYCQYSSFF